MKLPADMQSFLRNGANKETLFSLTEIELQEGKKKVGDKFIYFSNVNHCLKINQHVALIVTEKQSDHEEADTKLVALVGAANIEKGKKVMIRSPSGDIDIIVLFIHHGFDHFNWLMVQEKVAKLQICQHLYFVNKNIMFQLQYTPFQEMTMCLFFSER